MIIAKCNACTYKTRSAQFLGIGVMLPQVKIGTDALKLRNVYTPETIVLFESKGKVRINVRCRYWS